MYLHRPETVRSELSIHYAECAMSFLVCSHLLPLCFVQKLISELLLHSQLVIIIKCSRHRQNHQKTVAFFHPKNRIPIDPLIASANLTELFYNLNGVYIARGQIMFYFHSLTLNYSRSPNGKMRMSPKRDERPKMAEWMRQIRLLQIHTLNSVHRKLDAIRSFRWQF